MISRFLKFIYGNIKIFYLSQDLDWVTIFLDCILIVRLKILNSSINTMYFKFKFKFKFKFDFKMLEIA